MSEVLGADGSFTLAIQPRIAVVNGFGRLLVNYRGEIRVRANGRTVVGDTIIRPLNGLAQFERLAVLGSPETRDDTTQVQFSFSSSRFARPISVPVAGAWGVAVDDFRPIRVVVNGAELDSTFSVTAPPGDSLRISLTFEYSTHLPTANYIVGAAATWLPREQSTVRLAGLPRPVRRAWQTSSFTVPSPTAPGLHHVIVLMDAEDSVDHMFSLTSWTLGLPRWYDGNDVVDMNSEQLRLLRETGRVPLRRTIAPYDGRTGDRVVGNQRQTYVQQGDTVTRVGTLKGMAIAVTLPLP
jgi:hypothetical protein